MVKTQAWVQSLVGELTSQKVHGAAKKKKKALTQQVREQLCPWDKGGCAYPQIHLGLGLVEGWGGGVPE